MLPMYDFDHRVISLLNSLPIEIRTSYTDTGRAKCIVRSRCPFTNKPNLRFGCSLISLRSHRLFASFVVVEQASDRAHKGYIHVSWRLGVGVIRSLIAEAVARVGPSNHSAIVHVRVRGRGVVVGVAGIAPDFGSVGLNRWNRCTTVVQLLREFGPEAEHVWHLHGIVP